MSRHDETYERPLIEPDNLMTGGFQSGRFDAGPSVSAGRAAARWGLTFAVLWLGGIGSLIAIPLGVLALASGDVGTSNRRMAKAALALGALGLGATVAIFVTL